MGLYITSTLIACTVGIFFANTFKPGYQADQEQLNINRLSYEIWDNETAGVEFFDEIRLSENSKYNSLLIDAKENLSEQQENKKRA